MHIDARIIENNSLIEGDICVIGAGAAGISIALDWMNSGYKVILLEGGSFEYDMEIQKLYRGKVSGQKYYPIMSTRIHWFGGTTGHWGGFCSPLDDIDFKNRNWVEHSGWPILKRDLDPFYVKSKKILELHSDDYSLNYWQKQDNLRTKLPFNENLIIHKMWQFSPPTRFNISYKDPIVESPNIHLYTYANVIDIKGNDNVTRINQVTITNNSGKKHNIRANFFILACGAIQNARILLSSNKQLSMGLGNQYDNVGRFFMEHIEINSAELWLNKKLNLDLYLLKNGKTNARAELAINETLQEKYKILNGTVSLVPLLNARQYKPLIEKQDNEDPFYNMNNSSTYWEKIRRRLFLMKENRRDNINNAYALYTRMEQAPNPDCRISLDGKKDALGMPQTHLHFKLSSFEKRSISKIYEIIGQQVGIEDIGRIKLLKFLEDKNDQSWPDHTSYGRHHIGTTRMNNNPKKGVVDSNCKVHGIDNLYIAGSSCFPTGGAVNPTFTIVALSLRLSDHIKKKLTEIKV